MIQIPGYTIEKEIGEGGMATIYLALQESLQRKVVLKVMAPALAADATFGDRFTREARTVAQLNHPNILSVYDVGTSGFNHYIAMEYADHGDLKLRIQQGLTGENALGILKQVARALAHAHGKGFVHRDIKPENVLFRSDGGAVLSDFGIAKAIRSRTHITKTGTSIGTPHYMSPEQIQGKPVDARSDLYSLGIVFHEMLTGQVPYDASETIAIAYKHVHDVVPDLPTSLGAYQPIIDRLLAKEPSRRFQSAQELIAEITRAQSGKKLKRAARPTVAMATRAAKPAARHRSGSGFKWAATGAVLSLLLGAALFTISEAPAFPDIKRTINAAVSRLEHLKSLKPKVSANEISTAFRDNLTDRQSLEKLQPGKLLVKTIPEAAQIRILNIDRPFSQGMLLEPGRYKLEVSAQNYLKKQQWVTIGGKLEKQYILELTALGIIDVSAVPEGASVYLDGKPVGTTPCRIPGLADGTYSLHFEKENYMPLSKKVPVRIGGIHKVHVRMMSVRNYRRYEQYLQGGQTAMANGNKENALKAFNSALALKPEDSAALKGLKTTKQLPNHGQTFTNHFGMKFIYIAPATFFMGSPPTEPGRDPDERRHKVTLTKGYWLQATEVTQGQWQALMGNNPSRFKDAGKDFPVENVSFGDVQKFIKRLNDASASEQYRLPTEAEWEYGARGGSSEAFANGGISGLGCGQDDKLRKTAWYCGTAGERTHSVGQKRSNAWGLYDMHGNVWEWCGDWYGAYPFGEVIDPKGPLDGKYRISRGGSWYDGAGLCRSAYRGRFSPGRRSGDLGFRLVKSL
ncbi:MAG: SUMF1/EgtB/PvdO family nonheme iron enzyme [Desulfobacteraceae bacterium]|jgi:serine/threonine-protein kinase PpkA